MVLMSYNQTLWCDRLVCMPAVWRILLFIASVIAQGVITYLLACSSPSLDGLESGRLVGGKAARSAVCVNI